MLLIINSSPALQKIYFGDDFRLGSVNRVSKVLNMAGGKGVNTARALSCTGWYGFTLMVYAPSGFKNVLNRDLGPDHRSVIVETKKSLRTCTTLIDKKNKVTEITEPARSVGAESKQLFRDEYEDLIQNSKMLLISGSVVLGEDADFYYQLIKVANICKVPVMLDFCGEEILSTLKAGIDFLKINRDEFMQLGKMLEVKTEKEIVYCLQYRYKVKNIIVTNKNKAVSVFAGDRKLKIDVPVVEAINTTGCGDAFSAGFLKEYFESGDIETAVKRGIAVAAASSTTQEMAVFDRSYAEKLFADINSSDNEQSLFEV